MNIEQEIEEFKTIEDLSTKLNKKIIYLEQIDSTNEEIKRRAKNYEKDEIIIVAEEQTNGKGKWNRKWISQKGSGIWMSILLLPRQIPDNIQIITLIAGFSIYKAISEVTKSKVELKWPNDILINNKKICGILTESIIKNNNIEGLVVGIGINVNADIFPEEIKDKATSLKIEEKNIFSRKNIIEKLVFYFNLYYNIFLMTGTLKKFFEEYKKHCLTIGKDINISYDKEYINGIAIDISEKGELLVKQQDGKVISVIAGDIKYNITKII